MALSTLAAPAKRRRVAGKTSPLNLALLDDVGPEDGDANQHVYFITVSRVLPGMVASAGFRDIATLSRAELRDMVRDAFDDPVPVASGGGRPPSGDSVVEIAIVAKEQHADGSDHFHVVVKLTSNRRFKQAKLTLRERYKLPSHWSCTHRHVWSALRYLHVATPKKPVVDKDKLVWTWDGRDLDLDEKSKEPFVANAWRKRRERMEAAALVEGKKAPNFNKLDLTALIVSKHLHAKASLLSYVQDYGPTATQLFVKKHQRRIMEYIEDAQEWAEAKVIAGAEKMTDWDIVCKACAAPCVQAPGECSYAAAVKEIFARNAGSLSQHKMALALERIMCGGPSKTCRIPFLMGPSNTGKSTLPYPFDDLFGPKHVFHKPALGSTFALRNITKGKRFIFWDDYRPVEYAHEKTVPVSAFLSLFIGKNAEIQVSQSFSDGNLDVQCNRGIVFTAKSEGLWDPTGKVSAEDIQHIRNRVEEFHFTNIVTSLKDVESCAPCMARWITKFSDEASALTVPLAPVASSSAPVAAPVSVHGFADVMAAAKLAGAIVDALSLDVVATGAVHVDELALSDWQHLPSWNKLRPMEVRRLVAVVSPRDAVRSS